MQTNVKQHLEAKTYIFIHIHKATMPWDPPAMIPPNYHLGDNYRGEMRNWSPTKKDLENGRTDFRITDGFSSACSRLYYGITCQKQRQNNISLQSSSSLCQCLTKQAKFQTWRQSPSSCSSRMSFFKDSPQVRCVMHITQNLTTQIQTLATTQLLKQFTVLSEIQGQV